MKIFRSLSSSVIVLLLFACQPDDINDLASKGKLDYYIDSYETNNQGFKEGTKVNYEYNSSGQLIKYTVSNYNSNSTPEEQSHFEFVYLNDKLNKLKGFLVNQTNPYVEYTYQYTSDGKVLKINETNSATALTSEANFNYSSTNNTVKISFSYSNGSSFEYEYTLSGENIVSDKTTKGAELCSDGTYSYDEKINPFKTLGYLDYNLQGLSSNNKISEDVNYVACAFPSLVPVLHTYTYNEAGYPIEAITIYSTQTIKMKRQFFYK